MRPPVVSTLKHILFAKNWVVRARDIDKTHIDEIVKSRSLIIY